MLHVALARIDAGLAAPPPGWLAGDELERWRALSPRARPGFVGARALLRRLLARTAGSGAMGWTIVSAPGAAPWLRVPEGVRAPGIGWSHGRGWVAAAVDLAGGQVGVDVEVRRPPRTPADERAALMLAPAEHAGWVALPAAAREAALLRAWVAKEAWFKAQPDGHAPRDFRHIETSPCAPSRAVVRLWEAGPVVLGLSGVDPGALAAARCAGLQDSQQDGPAVESSWRVALLP